MNIWCCEMDVIIREMNTLNREICPWNYEVYISYDAMSDFGSEMGN
jgi:hypothetical protein